MTSVQHCDLSHCPQCGQIERPDGCRSTWHDHVPGDLAKTIQPATSDQSNITEELGRIAAGISLLEQLRELFGQMQDDGERDRAWNYLRSRFGEFRHAERPSHWEPLIEPDGSPVSE